MSEIGGRWVDREPLWGMVDNMVNVFWWTGLSLLKPDIWLSMWTVPHLHFHFPPPQKKFNSNFNNHKELFNSLYVKDISILHYSCHNSTYSSHHYFSCYSFPYSLHRIGHLSQLNQPLCDRYSRSDHSVQEHVSVCVCSCITWVFQENSAEISVWNVSPSCEPFCSFNKYWKQNSARVLV